MLTFYTNFPPTCICNLLNLLGSCLDDLLYKLFCNQVTYLTFLVSLIRMLSTLRYKFSFIAVLTIWCCIAGFVCDA